MSRHSHWNLIASGSAGDVAIDIAESVQFDDRYGVSIFLGDEQLDLQTRELDWLGTWLGMLTLELGRGIDHASEARGVSGELLRLVRGPEGFEIQLQSAGMARAVGVQGTLIEQFRDALEQAVRELNLQF